MSILNNQGSDLTKSLNEAQSDKMSELDLQYSINELASIIREAETLENKIIYTAESVPVFIADKDDGRKTFLIEHTNLIKLMESQHIDVSDALRHIKEALEEQLDGAIEFNTIGLDIGDFTVICPQEDIDTLAATCCEDPIKIQTRTEAVSNYNKFLNEIISEGAKISFNG